MSANDVQTLSGIVPAENNEVFFKENTAKVETFLQKKFDSTIERMNKKIMKWNEEHPDETPKPLQEDVEVNLITTRMSSKFYPFLLVLPASVLKERTGKHNKDELDIFNPQHTEHAANMKDPLYDLIQPFMYDDRDKNSFFSPTMQHELKISSRTAASMKANCRLKVHSFDKGRVSYVAVFLDPLRLFHNMATPVGGAKVPFVVNINKVEQIKGGNFRYHFSRVAKNKNTKNKRGVDFERQILQAVSGRK